LPTGIVAGVTDDGALELDDEPEEEEEEEENDDDDDEDESDGGDDDCADACGPTSISAPSRRPPSATTVLA
jgi:hypothetical protein